MTHLLIIEGSDAGISAALRARELDTAVEITIATRCHRRRWIHWTRNGRWANA
jgi:hypothetical protein